MHTCGYQCEGSTGNITAGELCLSAAMSNDSQGIFMLNLSYEPCEA